MCFFITLEVMAQKRVADAQAAIAGLAAKYDLCLQGEFPGFQITDGHCSCRLVSSEGQAVRPTAFLEELAQIQDVKHVRIGWTWAEGRTTAMKPDTEEARLSLAEFVTLNAAGELHADIWYRLHDADKYTR